MERYGFVARESFPILPMKVEYSLTSLGKELSTILGSLTSWTENNMKAIIQAEYDFLHENGLDGDKTRTGVID
jgi:DNA-binding HxlR family transcriptional regulator